MDDNQSKQYESIDALIKAAEVLERNEFISKSKMSSNVINGKQHINICNNDTYYQPSKRKWKYIKGRQLNEISKEQFSNSLIQTLEYIKELRNDERWYSLMENKLKSDNQALYQELNYLKRKLNKMKQMTIEAKRYKSVDDALYENEDTSTASEDEDYNKYDYNKKILEDNVDDVTDDASECEEISQISANTNVYEIKHISKRHKNHRLQNLVPESYSKKIELPLLTNRKRKCNPSRVCYSSDSLKIKNPLRYSSKVLSHSIRDKYNFNSRKCPRTISASKCGLIQNPDCEVSSDVHHII